MCFIAVPFLSDQYETKGKLKACLKDGRDKIMWAELTMSEIQH